MDAKAKEPPRSKTASPRPRLKKRKADVDRFQFERQLLEQGARRIAGVDEVGRGPLAGPVIACAVILPADFSHPTLNDSKQLSAEQREAICEELKQRADVSWAIGIVEHAEIDRLNILGATYLAMKKAVDALAQSPDFLLIDGRPVPTFSRIKQLALVKGDSRSFSIAAASVIAKVTRDRIMNEHHQTWPAYGFNNHKGYATLEHRRALAKFGPSPIHRTSFLPVAARQRTGELPL